MFLPRLMYRMFPDLLTVSKVLIYNLKKLIALDFKRSQRGNKFIENEINVEDSTPPVLNVSYFKSVYINIQPL